MTPPRTAAILLAAMVLLTGAPVAAQSGAAPMMAAPAAMATSAAAATPAESLAGPIITPPPPAAKRKAERRTVTILGSGDVLLHEQLWAQARADATSRSRYNFRKIYSSVRPEVSAADLAICQLETPVSKPKGPFSGWPRFSVPPQVLGAIKAVGYDSCTTASNHTLDAGQQGVYRTLNRLDKAGLEHTGSARSKAEARRPLIITTESGVRVGQLAYTFGFNGLSRPAGKAWIANQIDVDAILAAAHRLKRAGADIVVLSMHWGDEYQHLASATQRAQARRLAASPDIDLILGAHAHVVQPMEKIRGTWVVYGMGNQVARHANPIDDSREGIMPVITFTERADGTFRATGARVVPTWMEFSPKLRLIDLKYTLVTSDLPDSLRKTYRAAVKRIRGYIGAYGAKVPVQPLGR